MSYVYSLYCLCNCVFILMSHSDLLNSCTNLSEYIYTCICTPVYIYTCICTPVYIHMYMYTCILLHGIDDSVYYNDIGLEC